MNVKLKWLFVAFAAGLLVAGVVALFVARNITTAHDAEDRARARERAAAYERVLAGGAAIRGGLDRANSATARAESTNRILENRLAKLTSGISGSAENTGAIGIGIDGDIAITNRILRSIGNIRASLEGLPGVK